VKPDASCFLSDAPYEGPATTAKNKSGLDFSSLRQAEHYAALLLICGCGVASQIAGNDLASGRLPKGWPARSEDLLERRLDVPDAVRHPRDPWVYVYTKNLRSGFSEHRV
jgi:hypothetical protein